MSKRKTVLYPSGSLAGFVYLTVFLKLKFCIVCFFLTPPCKVAKKYVFIIFIPNFSLLIRFANELINILRTPLFIIPVDNNPDNALQEIILPLHKVMYSTTAAVLPVYAIYLLHKETSVEDGNRIYFLF